MSGRAGVDTRIASHLIEAAAGPLEIDGCIDVEVAITFEKAERLKANAPFRAEQHRPADTIEVGGPSLQDVERDAALEAHQSDTDLFDVVARGLTTSFVDRGGLVDLPGDA